MQKNLSTLTFSYQLNYQVDRQNNNAKPLHGAINTKPAETAMFPGLFSFQTKKCLLSNHLFFNVCMLFCKSRKNSEAINTKTARYSNCKTKNNFGNNSFSFRKRDGRNNTGAKTYLIRFITRFLYRFLIPLSVILTLIIALTQNEAAIKMAVIVMLIGTPILIMDLWFHIIKSKITKLHNTIHKLFKAK